MSTLDISRFLNQPRKHYAGARLQQGRILTDADFNEAAQYAAEDRRRSVNDFFGEGIIGTGASPDDGFSLGIPIDGLPAVPSQTDPIPPGAGFVIEPESFLVGEAWTFVRPVSIRAGTFYLGGMRLELEQPEPFMLQRDFLQMKPDDVPVFDRGGPGQTGPFSQLYYVEAWEQCVTPVEDHEFLETALGPHGTSGRIRRMRRVRAFTVQGDQPENCEEAWSSFRPELESERNGDYDETTGEIVPRGRLQIAFDSRLTIQSCAECNPAPDGRFLGADNQTLRILLTRQDRFVWALDDSAPLYRVKVEGLGSSAPIVVTLLSPLKDEAHAPLVGRVVEIIPFAAVLDGRRLPGSTVDPHYNKVADEVGAFSRVVESYDPNTRTFTLSNTAPGIDEMRAFVHAWDVRHPAIDELFIPDGSSPTDERFFFMRLWHEAQSDDDIELVAEAQGTRALGSTGVLASFVTAGQRGDSWSIALRPETPLGMVPFQYAQSIGVPPDGPRHFFAPLALLRHGGDVTIENTDCRPILRPLTDVDCVTFTVGNDRLTRGEFTSIQEAIDSLPTQGGTVLVRPGLYVEDVVIQDRTNVALVGCGNVTILQSPDNSDLQGLIRIIGGSKIRVSGFTARVAAEQAVSISDHSSEITVADLGIDVGEYSGGQFVLGSAESDVALVGGEDSSQIALSGLHLKPVRRAGISLSSCSGILVQDVMVTGAANARAAQAPMIELTACRAAVLDGVSLNAFGQFGIRLSGTGNRDIEIVRLAAQCEPNTAIEGRASTGRQRRRQPKPALDVEGGRRISLRQSRVQVLTDVSPWVGRHAAVVVGGRDLEISDNHILADEDAAGASAWGGLQIRGGSSCVTVRGNHIAGGVGHGITLGSVLWSPTIPGPARREGAGENQMFESDGHFVVDGTIRTIKLQGVDHTAIDEGPLTEIVIAGNRIEGFSSNGISSLTVFGLGSLGSTDFIEITRLRIENNRIRNNVRFPAATYDLYFPPVFNAMPPFRNTEYVAGTPVLSYGGVVLGHVNQGDIVGNLVSDNGTSPIVPTNGIFVASAESLAICHNVISGNGGQAVEGTTNNPGRGTRAGIAVLLAGLGTPPSETQLENVFETGGNALSSDGLSVRISNNNVRHPEGRAVYVVATGPVQIDGNFFSSEGFHGRTDAGQDAFAIGDAVFVQNLGGPWERFNIEDVAHQAPSGTSRGSFDDFDTPRDAVVYLFNEMATSPRHFVGLGGQVMFQNNQVVYDWEVRRRPQPQHALTTFAVAIMGLDHTSVGANQFAMRLILPSGFAPRAASSDMGSDEPFFSHVFVTGATAEVTSNRISETADTARFSMLVLSELSQTVAHNQGMHEVFGISTASSTGGSFRQFIENQQLLERIAPSSAFNTWVYNEGLRLFMQLLNRPPSPILTNPVPAPPSG